MLLRVGLSSSRTKARRSQVLAFLCSRLEKKEVRRGWWGRVGQSSLLP